VLCIFRPFSGWHLRLKSYIRNTCNTSPVIGVIRARAYTSIRELPSQVLRAIDTQVKARLDDNLAPCQSLLRVIKAKEKQSISDAANYDDRTRDFRIGITPAQDSLQHSSEYLKPAQKRTFKGAYLG
jgi:hypothetical protein